MTALTITKTDLGGLKHKTALVTGGSSGIGQAFVSLISSFGGRAVNGDLKEPEETPSGVTFVKTDVSSWKSLLNLFRAAKENLGNIDVVFVNAGVPSQEEWLDIGFDKVGELVEPEHTNLQINLYGTINTTILAVHYLRQQVSGGAIILTASASSYQRFPSSDYGKHGVLGLLRSLKDQLHPREPIRVNAIAPSWTATGMLPKILLDKVTCQPASAVALSVGLLALNEDYHGKMIYSANGQYLEVEGPILDFTEQLFAQPISEGQVVINMLETLK